MSKHHGAWSVGGRPDLHQTVVPLDTKGPKRLWDHPAGFVIRERGDVDGLVTHEYLCPVHRRFDAKVPRSNVPDALACPAVDRCVCCEKDPMLRGQACPVHDFGRQPGYCGASSPWSPSTFNAWQSAGEVKS